MIFRNTSGDTATLIVEDCWKDDTPPCSKSTRDICEIRADFYTIKDSIWDISVHGYMNFGDNRDISLYYAMESDLHAKSKYIEKDDPMFGDTLILSKLSHNTFIRFNELKIVKGIGLVEFYDKEYDCYWERVFANE